MRTVMRGLRRAHPPALGWRRPSRPLSASRGLFVVPLLLGGCSGGGQSVTQGPLGWDGPIQAPDVARWSARDLYEAPRWGVAEPAAFVVVPDSVFAPDGTGFQRYVADALVTAGEQVVILTDPVGPDSILLRIVDVTTGEETAVQAPVRADGQPVAWADLTMATNGTEIVVLGSVRTFERDRTEGVWFADADGRFARPSHHVPIVGPLEGVLSDGSLVVSASGWMRTTDTTVISALELVRPIPVDRSISRAERPVRLFEIALVRNQTADYPVPSYWAHDPRANTGVSGDIIWTVPTDRPELVGVDRAGRVFLKVEWEAGDRTIPAGASDGVSKALRGLRHLPAARRLLVGTNGLIHVQQTSWADGRLLNGPQWLVFSPSGDLVARIEIPRHLDVMAFGPDLVVARTRDDDGVEEIRIHKLQMPS